MAKVKIKRIEIAAQKTDCEKIVKYLQRRGVVELIAPDELTAMGLTVRKQSEEINRLDNIKNEANSAIDALKPYYKGKGGMLSSLSGRSEISDEEFEIKSKAVNETIETIHKVNDTVREIADINVELVRTSTRQDQLKMWLDYDLPLSFKGQGSFCLIVGSFPHEYTRENILTFIAEKSPETDAVECEIVSTTKTLTCACVFCLKKDVKQIELILRENEFTPVTETTEDTPKAEYDRLSSEKSTLDAKLKEEVDFLKRTADETPQIEFLLDYISIERDSLQAKELLATSKALVFLQGYIPETLCDKVKSKVEENYNAVVDFYEPGDDEDVPVKLKNNGFCQPLEWITEMYSLPGKNDIDPTPVMSFFYYFFFGMMLSDAGYGLIITIAAAIALKVGKFKNAFKDKIKMFMFCGISTVFWGAMYGSWFGDLPVVVAQTFMGKEKFSMALWKDPLNELLNVLVWCFIFGVIHLFVGVAVKGYTCFKQGKKLDAFCETVPTYVCILGLAPIFFGLFTDVPPILKKIGTPVLIIGVILVIATAGRESKKIGGKIGKGLYGLYNLISGYLGDVLSYARLLALGLSTGVIAQVVNMLCTLPQSKVLQAIMLVVVGLFGHILNLLINIIGAYVHTNRLQYVEFFGKFYEGGGRKFTPLQINTKSYKFKEENQ